MLTAKNYRAFHHLAIILATLSAAAYAFFIITLSQNIPIYDDYVDGVPFALSYMEATGLKEQLELIFSQYNQHRIAFNRLLYSLNLEFSGEINFYFITLVGNLNLFVLAFCYYKLVCKTEHSQIATACIALLLFQLNYFHTALWPMASVANFSVLPMALACLIYLEKTDSKLSYAAAIIISAITTITLGSGQFILLAGALMIAIQLKRASLPLMHWRLTTVSYTHLTLPTSDLV